jgi:hypothetical protein
MRRSHLLSAVLLLTMDWTSAQSQAVTSGLAVNPAFLCAPVHSAVTAPDGITPSDSCATCNGYVDATTFLMPNYAGWQTARQTQTQTAPYPATTYTRKLLYGTNQFELIKFDDPHSSETYTWDNSYIYLTAENGINGGTQSRIYPPGNDPLYPGVTIAGLVWMPRYVCTGTTPAGHIAEFNTFYPRYASQVWYDNCNSCPCQYDHTVPAHVARYSSTVSVINYNYGSLGWVSTIEKDDLFDDLTESEHYFYGSGYGLLRFEADSHQGQVLVAGQETAEVPNQPIADQACFHP